MNDFVTGAIGMRCDECGVEVEIPYAFMLPTTEEKVQHVMVLAAREMGWYCNDDGTYTVCPDCKHPKDKADDDRELSLQD